MHTDSRRARITLSASTGTALIVPPHQADLVSVADSDANARLGGELVQLAEDVGAGAVNGGLDLVGAESGAGDDGGDDVAAEAGAGPAVAGGSSVRDDRLFLLALPLGERVMLAAPLGFDISMILIRPRARTFHRTVDFVAAR